MSTLFSHKAKKLKMQGHLAAVLIPAMIAAFLVPACGSKRQEDINDESSKTAPNPNQSKGAFEIPTTNSDTVAKSSDPCALDLEQKTVLRPGESTIDASFAGKTDVQACSADGKHPVLYSGAQLASFLPPSALDCQPKPAGEFNIRCLSPGSFIAGDGTVNILIKANAEYQSSKVRMRIMYEK